MCGSERGPFGENGFFPFCSARCRMADLGKWLNEEYAIPDTTPDEDEEEQG
jgi:hypothetical protein